MEKLSTSTNALNWFEIPVTDVERAKRFYESAFDIKMDLTEMLGMQMVIFPSQHPKTGGALVKSAQHKPSTVGSVVYLNGNPNLQTVLDKIEEAGGRVIMPKTSLGESGNMALFLDAEGNLVGLHSVQ